MNGFEGSDGWRTICCRIFATDPTSASADVCVFCCKLFTAGKIAEVFVAEQVDIPGRLVIGEVNVEAYGDGKEVADVAIGLLDMYDCVDVEAGDEITEVSDCPLENLDEVVSIGFRRARFLFGTPPLRPTPLGMPSFAINVRFGLHFCITYHLTKDCRSLFT